MHFLTTREPRHNFHSDFSGWQYVNSGAVLPGGQKELGISVAELSVLFWRRFQKPIPVTGPSAPQHSALCDQADPLHVTVSSQGASLGTELAGDLHFPCQ